MIRNSNNGFLFITGIILTILCIIYLIYSGIIFTLHNWVLSSIITFLLGSSILSLIRLWLNLKNQEAQIEKVFGKTFTTIDEIKSLLMNLKDSLIKERLLQIDNTYDLSNKVNYSEIEYISIRRQKNYGSIEKYIVNATILIGWIGTFIGIIQSLKNLNVSDQNVQMPLINEIISGLYLAIGASILGIFSSLSLGFIYTIYKNFENNVFTKLEEVSVLKIVPIYSIVENSLISKAIIDSMNRVLPSIIKQSTDDLKEATFNLKGVTEEIKINQQSISSLIEHIEHSVVSATENNTQIQILLGAFNGHISKLTPTLDKVETILSLNRDVFQQIISENQSNFQAIKETYRTLREHSEILKTYSSSIQNDFSDFLDNSSASNDQTKKLISDTLKLFSSNQLEAINKIAELNNKLVQEIINIEKNKANELVIKKDSQELKGKVKNRRRRNFFLKLFRRKR